jgi:carbohydrate-selective porin OprB
MSAVKVCIVTIVALCFSAISASSQDQQTPTRTDQTLSGPDSHETEPAQRGHLFGDWRGARSRLSERGVDVDAHYVSDSLGNVESDRSAKFFGWNRVRGTVDIDLQQLRGWPDWYFHATGLWQTGGNLGAYLGLLTSPSGMSSEPTFRLDSWWFEKRWRNERVTARAGQFAGQDFYGAQHYAASFIFEPMGYALGNLFTDIESFDPPSTPAAEIRVVPMEHVYVKTMLLTGDPAPFTHNPTGFVPEFHGNPVSVAEIGFTPGKKATTIRAFDTVETRKGYSGLYQIGASYNPGQFTTATNETRSGNNLWYVMASQAIWRGDPTQAKGLDATIAYDWSPTNVNRNNTLFTAGVRFNEPFPLHVHNTMSVGYVQNRLSQQFVPPGAPPFNPENAIEVNALVDVSRMVLLQPVVQIYGNAGGGTQHAVVVGFRTKVEF